MSFSTVKRIKFLLQNIMSNESLATIFIHQDIAVNPGKGNQPCGWEKVMEIASVALVNLLYQQNSDYDYYNHRI